MSLRLRLARWSLSRRLVLSASLVLMVFIVVTALALERAFRESARSAMHDKLLAQVYLLIAAAEVDTAGKVHMPDTLAEPRFDVPGSGLYAEIRNAQGQVLWRSPSALGQSFPSTARLDAGRSHFATQREAGQSFFVLGYGVRWNTAGHAYPLTFSVTQNQADYLAQLQRYRNSLWGWLGGMAVLLLFAQVLVLRWGLSPLRDVARAVADIEAGRAERISGAYPRELRGLTGSLNALLTHEHAQQTRYRNALADLAHSLKTPLAVLRGGLDRPERSDRAARSESESAPGSGSERTHGVLHSRSGQARQADSAALLEQVDHMDRLVAYQLQKAATAGRGGLRAPIALAPLARRLLGSLDKVYRDKGVRAELDVEDSVRARVDEGDLMELFGNLLDNAYKWCRSQVRVGVTLQGDTLSIEVEDDGPGIAEADAGRLLGRGVRADTSVPGHGIGLAVVRDIVQAYGGELHIERAPLGGARFRLSLSLA